MADIRIKNLPVENSPVASEVVAIDGATTRQTTISKLVLAGRPTASKAEAEAGVQSTKAMTPLTTAQAIVARAATASQGEKADTSVQPVANLTQLKALDATKVTGALLKQDGRRGEFAFVLGDFSSQVSADTLEGLYVESNVVPASTGVWARVWDGTKASVHWWGAIGDYSESSPGAATDNSAAFNAAIANAQVITARPGLYMHSETINLGKYKKFVCEGWAGGAVGTNSQAELLFASQSNVILVPRNLPQTHTSNAMISSRDFFGGILANPNAGEAYTTSSGTRLNTYNLEDFTNRDATGTTPATARQFSVGLKIGRNSTVSGVIVRSTLASGELISVASENFGVGPDVGVWAENPYYARLDGCHVGWGFRIAALLCLNHNSGDGQVPEGDGFYAEGSFEGHSSVMIRGADRVYLYGRTASTIVIPWWASHQFNPAGGTVRVGATAYAYTSTSYTAGSPNLLTFNGVTPNPSALTIGSAVQRDADYNDSGVGEMEIIGQIRSLTHASLKFSTDGTVPGYFDHPGNAIEISGAKIRGVRLRVKGFGREDVFAFLGDCGDVDLDGYVEAKDVVGTSASCRIVALSVAEMLAGRGGVAYPVGGSRAIDFNDSWNQVSSSVDTTPTWRNASSIGRFSTTDGLFAPDGTENRDYSATSRDGTAYVVKAPWTAGSKHPVQYKNSAGNVRASMDQSGRWQWGFVLDTETALTQPFNFFSNGGFVGLFKNTNSTTITGVRAENGAGYSDFVQDATTGALIRIDGVAAFKFDGSTFRPAVAGAVTIGTATFTFLNSRITTMITQAIRHGMSVNGPVDTSGTGSPEGVVTGPVSSTYRRTDGGAGTSFYVKESGAGNTGWVAK